MAIAGNIFTDVIFLGVDLIPGCDWRRSSTDTAMTSAVPRRVVCVSWMQLVAFRVRGRRGGGVCSSPRSPIVGRAQFLVSRKGGMNVWSYSRFQELIGFEGGNLVETYFY